MLNKSWIGNLESSAWSGALGRLSFRANGTSDKSRGGLLEGQCDFNKVLGGARKRLGVLDEEAGGFFRQQGALVSGVPVCLEHLGAVWNGVMSNVAIG